MNNHGSPRKSPFSGDPYGNGPEYGGDYPDYGAGAGAGYRHRGYDGQDGWTRGYEQDEWSQGHEQDGWAQGHEQGGWAQGHEQGGWAQGYEQGGYADGYGDGGYPAQSGAGATGAGGHGGKSGSSMMMTVGIVTVVIAGLLLGAIGIGMWLGRGDDAEEPRADGDPGSAATTGVVADEEDTDAGESAPSPTATTTTTTTTAASAEEDYGTGRSDVDSQGWTGSYARCSSGDDVLAVLEVLDGNGNPMQTVACEASNGRKYYRGTGTAGTLEVPITGYSPDSITAKNGEWEYEMTPAGLYIRSSSTSDLYDRVSWGRP